MAISRLQKIGQQTGGTGTSSLVITVGAGGTTVGKHILVAVQHGKNVSPTVTCADSKGNTYQLDVSQNYTANNTASCYLLSAIETAALVSGDTITVSFSVAVNNGQILAYEYDGLDTTSWFDKSASNHNTLDTSNPSSGATPTTTAADELLFAVASLSRGVGGTFPDPMTAGSGYTLLDNIDSGDNTRSIATEEKIVSATGAYTATFTKTDGPLIDTWGCLIGTYKAAGAAPPSAFTPRVMVF